MMAQPEVQMSHLDGGGGGNNYTKHGVIVGAGRREHEPVPPSGNTALPPGPSAPLFPGPAPAPGGNWDVGWEWDSGVGGRNGEAASPTRPPLRPGPAPAQALRHKRLSLLSALTI